MRHHNWTNVSIDTLVSVEDQMRTTRTTDECHVARKLYSTRQAPGALQKKEPWRFEPCWTQH
jgi:hypothetical protein